MANALSSPTPDRGKKDKLGWQIGDPNSPKCNICGRERMVTYTSDGFALILCHYCDRLPMQQMGRKENGAG